MNKQDYGQKRRECWEEYVNMLNRNCATRYVFDQIFDRAYALGKQTEAITREEIEKVAKRFADEIRIPASISGVMVPFINGLAHDAYLQGARDFLGKQEKDTDTVIQGWVARASDGHLALFKRKPDREIYMRSNNGLWFGGSMTELDSNLFSDLTWDSEPLEVEIQIKRKKK